MVRRVRASLEDAVGKELIQVGLPNLQDVLLHRQRPEHGLIDDETLAAND